eukprot:5202266-Pleurochrysis_carterae.AAC.1
MVTFEMMMMHVVQMVVCSVPLPENAREMNAWLKIRGHRMDERNFVEGECVPRLVRRSYTGSREAGATQKHARKNGSNVFSRNKGTTVGATEAGREALVHSINCIFTANGRALDDRVVGDGDDGGGGDEAEDQEGEGDRHAAEQPLALADLEVLPEDAAQRHRAKKNGRGAWEKTRRKNGDTGKTA